MKNKIIISIIIFSLVLLFSNIVSAIIYQDRMAIKECIYSFNDENFGSWNDLEQKGVFMKVKNNNLNIGPTENSLDYTYTSYQQPRTYYNNFEYRPDLISKIPILNVMERPENNQVYVDCKFKVGNYKLFFNSFYITSSIHNYAIFMTQDFNLTKDIMEYEEPQTAYSRFDYSPHIPRLFGRNEQKSEKGYRSSAIIYVGNEVENYDGTGISFLRAKGFYPNTNPTVKFKINLNNAASGLYYMGPYIYANGRSLFWTNEAGHNTMFYINSSMKTQQDILDILIPRFSKTIKRISMNTSENVDENYIYDDGEYANVTYEFYNPFSIDLTNIKFKARHLSWITKGVGYNTDIKNPYAYNCINEPTLDFKGKSLMNISFICKYPPYLSESAPIYRSPLSFIVRVDNVIDHYLPKIGTTNTSYLGIEDIDPKITLVDGNASFQIDFSIYPYGDIIPNEYELLVNVYNNSNVMDRNIVYSETIALTEEMASESKIPLQITISVDPTIYEPGITHYVDIFTVKKLPPPNNLVGKKIARLLTIPNFESGPLQYYPHETEGGDTFFFSESSKTDSRPIRLFNPDFYSHTLTLELKDLTDPNFVFNIPNTMEIELKPLENKVIDIIASANHDPWPTNDITKSFKIKVTSDQVGSSPTELIYHLDISKAYWINIAKDKLVAKEAVVVQDSEVEVNASWKIRGSEAALNDLNGTAFNVKLYLIKDENIVDTKTYSSKIPDHWTTQNFIANFNIDSGDYALNMTLDTDNDIIENISAGSPKEDDNQIMVNPAITTRDADENRSWCQLKFGKSISQINCTIGQSGCWSYYPEIISKRENLSSCCGDDNSDECWIDNKENACCYSNLRNGVYYINDPDDSSDYCSLLSKKENSGISNAICNEDDYDKRYCWHNEKHCCGNDDVFWTYSTIDTISDIIPDATCYKNKWTETKKGMYYPIEFGTS